MRSKAPIPLVAVLVAIGLLAGCPSTNDPNLQRVLTVLEGDAQVVTVGQSAAIRPAVKVATSAGPVSGVTVTFAVASGGGSLTGATQQTDASGIARVGGWTLGSGAGANTLTATAAGIQGSPLTFQATGRAGAAVAASKQAGDGQNGTVGQPLTTPPAVRVVDQYGNPVAGVQVVFTLTQGGGAVSGGTQTTGADGVATVGGWTLGQQAGSNGLSASVSGVTAPLAFSATGVAAAPATLTKQAGDNQSALTGDPVAVAPSVLVSDVFGNPVGNRPVDFTVAAGGGAVTGAAPLTGASGLAAVGSWNLGPTAGPNTLTARVGVFTVSFSATANPRLNAQLYVGTYAGTWNNTTFGSTGTGTAVVSVNAATSTVTVTGSATGNVLGSGGVAPTTRNTTYGAASAAFAGNAPVMGDITASIGATGQITASGINVPNAAIVRWDATGTITATQLQLNFTVTFTSGPPAVGTIVLTKQ